MSYSECSTNVRLIFFTATGDTGGAFLFRLIGGLDTLVFLLFLVAGVSVMEGEGSAAEGGEQAVVVAKLDPGQGEVTSELINSGLDWSAGLRLSKTGVDGVGWLLTPEKADPGLMGDRVRSSGEAGW